MQGFQPGKQKPKNYANGGIVKGPGTGTSDDVPAMVPNGGYIMPADSTKALGFKPGMRPAQVSNGEAVLTPEQVEAAGGVEALEAMRAATHEPVADGNSQQGPQFFFANGGPLDEDKRKPFMPVLPKEIQDGMTKMYSDGMPVPAAAKSAAGAGRGFAVPGVPPVTRERDVRQAQMAADAGRRAAAQAATDARYADTGAQEAAAARAAFSTRIGNSAIRPYRDPAAAPVTASQAAASAPASQPVANAVGFQAQRPVAPPAIVQPAPAPAPAPASAAMPGSPAAQASIPQTAGNVNVRRQANGVMEFSGENVVGDVSYNGAGAAGFKPSGAGVSVVPAGSALGFQPQQQQAQQTQAVQVNQPAYIPQDTGGVGLLDKNRIELRNAMIDAKQGDPGAASVVNSLLQQQAAAPGQQLDRDKLGVDIASDNAERTLRAEEAQSARGFRAGQLANDTARTALEAKKTGQEMEARGFEVGQAKRMETLRAQYESATDPKVRADLEKRIRVMSGKDDQANRFTVVPGGQEWDATANVMRNVPARVLNNQTGQFVDGAAGSNALPPLKDNAAAMTIVNDQSLSKEQRAAKLREMGYN